VNDISDRMIGCTIVSSQGEGRLVMAASVPVDYERTPAVLVICADNTVETTGIRLP